MLVMNDRCDSLVAENVTDVSLKKHSSCSATFCLPEFGHFGSETLDKDLD